MLLSDVNAAVAELEVWKHVSEDLDTHEMCLLLLKSHMMFPNIHTILKVLLTMQVSTSIQQDALQYSTQVQNLPSQFCDGRPFVQFGFDGQSPWL